MPKKKILFVAMQMSTHTARWINQLSDQDWDVHLFPVSYAPIHPELRNLTVHQPWFVVSPESILRNIFSNKKGAFNIPDASLASNKPLVDALYPLPVLNFMLPYLNGIKRVSLGESEAKAPFAYGPKILARLIQKLKPDLIHSLEFQHCGYNVLRAKEIIGDSFPKWFATNWGSDIYYYRRFKKHRSQISRLLQNIDYYSCECERDVELAKGLGYTGKVMPVMPNTGGLDLEKVGRLRSIHKTSKRKIVMVKGYQHFVGRALTALDAVEMCTDDLRDYRVVVFSASLEIFDRVEELRTSGLDIVIFKNSSHESMLEMFSQARVYLGVSFSDACSTSMLEALAMGAFPIQTNTSCCNEWFDDGSSGFAIPVDGVDVIADRLRKALGDDLLVDHAAELNWKTAQQRLDQSVLKPKAIKFYETIFQDDVRKGQ